MESSGTLAIVTFALGLLVGIVVSRLLMGSRLKLYEQFISERLSRQLSSDGLFSPRIPVRVGYAQSEAKTSPEKLVGVA